MADPDTPPPPPAPLTPDPAMMMATRHGIPVEPRRRTRPEGPTVPHTMVGMVVAIVALAFLVGALSGYLAGLQTEPNRKVDRLQSTLCRVLDETGADSTSAAERDLCPTRNP